MSKKSNLKPIVIALGVTFAVSLGGYMIAAGMVKHEQDAETHIKWGYAKIIQSDYAGAMADSSRAIELDPDNAQAYYTRGVANSNLGDHRGAIADCNRAIEIDPGYANAYNNRGNAKFVLDDHDGAEADRKRAIELNSEIKDR